MVIISETKNRIAAAEARVLTSGGKIARDVAGAIRSHD
jgi:hypothetical protein